MKRYVAKFLAVLAVIVVFIMAIYFKAPRNIGKYINTIANENKLQGSCNSGDGKVQFTTSDALKVYSSASSLDKAVSTLDANTEVRVYCTQGDWAKISKVSEKWVNTASLTETKPSEQSKIRNVTLDEINFDLEEPTYFYEEGLDQLYMDRNGTIEIKAVNLIGIAQDDADRFSVRIKKDEEEKTGDFNIIKTLENDILTIRIEMTNGENEVKYTDGIYNVIVDYDFISKNKEFQIVQRYYDFKGEYQQKSNYPNNPANRRNAWEVKLKDFIGISDEDKNLIVPTIVDEWDNDASIHFNLTKNNNETYTIENKTGRFYRPPSGTYKIRFSYNNEGYSNSRGTITYEFQIVIGARSISFEQQGESISNRYYVLKEIMTYSVEMISKETVNNVIYYNFIDNGQTYKLSENDFKSTYQDFNLALVSFASTGKIVFKHGTDVTVTKVLNGNITYIDEEGVSHVVTEAQFQASYTEAYEKLMQKPGDMDENNNPLKETYSFDSAGNIHYHFNGMSKLVITKGTYDRNQNLLAGDGGIIRFTYEIDGLEEDDIEKLTYEIIHRKDADGNTLDENKTSDTNFKVTWKFHEKTSEEERQKVDIIVDCDFTDVLVDERGKYLGYYDVNLKFPGATPLAVPFSIYDGEVDFYLHSTVDQHISEPDALDQTYPPANKRYEYYVGFHLVKNGVVQTRKNTSEIGIQIYDRMADLDENKQIYFYDEIGYEVRLKNYLNNQITFDVKEGDEENFTTLTMPIEEFNQKYSDIADMVDMYNFDETTGELLSGKFEYQITRFYLDEKTNLMRVTFFDKNNKKLDVTMDEFKVKYPDMYYYMIRRFVFENTEDLKGVNVLGALQGAYRITEIDGKKIEGHDVTNQFKIVVDPDDTNVDKAITILPKTEVNAGVYYVYTSYGNSPGVGYVNGKKEDGSDNEDAPISKELFPENWLQNIHRTSLIYTEPVYDISIGMPTLSNEGNIEERIYDNINGKAEFAVDLEFIYDMTGIETKVEYYNEANSEWEDANNDFTQTITYSPYVVEDVKKQMHASLANVIGKVKQGKYRFVVTYQNKGVTKDAVSEFEVYGKYYGLVIETESFEYTRNKQEEKTIIAKGMFVEHPENIEFTLNRVNETGEIVAERYVHDAENKQFKDEDGNIMFQYDYEVDYDAYTEANTLQYKFKLSNVKDETDIGKYVISFIYQEDTFERTETTFSFEVLKEAYVIEFGDEHPKADEHGLVLEVDVATQFILDTALDDIEFVVMYFDEKQGKYIDVSTEGVEKRMFVLTHPWDMTTGPDYKGTLRIELNSDLVDMAGNYYIEGRYLTEVENKNLTSLEELFGWKIEQFGIKGIYHGTKLDENGNEVPEDQEVEGFYNNLEDTNIDIKLKTIHEDNIKWVINTECLDSTTCNPSAGTNYNDRFVETNTTGTDGRLQLKVKEGLQENERLKPRSYALVLYYTEEDYKIVRLDVHSEYVNIELGNALMYSDITTDRVEDGLFANKKGHIHMPVIVSGVPYENTTIKITDVNGTTDVTNQFIIDLEKYKKQHVLDVTYNANTINPNDYVLMISYESSDTNYTKDLPFTIYTKYFNFNFLRPTYTPDPLAPNAENGGIIEYRVTTEDLGDVKNVRDIIAKNTVIKDADNKDVTNSFKIEAVEIPGSLFDFILKISFAKDTITPGFYKVSSFYIFDGYVCTKETSFIVGDYEKTISITNVEMITDAKDGKIHNNILGTYRLHYRSYTELDKDKMSVIVQNEKGEEVNNQFTSNIEDTYIDVLYQANEPYLESGNYKIIVQYTDDETGKVTTKEQTIRLYDYYQEIRISNMKTASNPVYADQNNQFYTFDVFKDLISEDAISSLQARIFNEKDEIVYSDFESDKVTNCFEVLNHLKESNGNYRINILAFKARVGTYKIRLYLKGEDDEYYESNDLTFKIDTTYYKVDLNASSTLNQRVNYDSANRTTIYDHDGAIGNYTFSSTFPSVDYAEYSIQILKDGHVVKEIKPLTINTQNNTLNTRFETGEIEAGNYEVFVAINGLPYVGKTMTVSNYIPVTKVTILLDGVAAGKNVELYLGDAKGISYRYEPANATNKNFTWSTDNARVGSIANNRINGVGVGSTVLRISNRDITASTNIKVTQRLTSSAYTINYKDKTIYVRSMTSTTLTKNTFVSNLKGLVNGYQILNSSNKVINTSVIGTSMSIKNGDETYKIIVIGDINGDGTISVFDVSMLRQYIRRKINITDKNKLKAADIRKANDISVFDVSKLRQFIRGKIKTL